MKQSLVDIYFSFLFSFFFSLLPHSSRNPVGANSPNPSRHLLSVLNSHLPNPKEIFFTKRPKKKIKIRKLPEPVTDLISFLETNRGYHRKQKVQTNVLTTFRPRKCPKICSPPPHCAGQPLVFCGPTEIIYRPARNLGKIFFVSDLLYFFYIFLFIYLFIYLFFFSLFFF